MPEPVYAPRASEAEQRKQRIQTFLTQLGIDARQLDDFLRNPFENVGTPLEEVRTFRQPNMEDPTHVASSLAGAFLGGRTSEAVKCRDQGIIAFCGTEEEAAQFLGKILQAYSRVLGGQGISEDTLSWLGRIERRASEGGALQRTVLSDMSVREQRQWVDENLDTLANAAIFQAWARSRGVDQEAVDEAGRGIYGGLWDTASAIGMNLKFENGVWKLHGSRRGAEATTSLTMDALRGLEPLHGRDILASVPTRGEAAAELSAEEQFDAYYKRIQRHPEELFSRGARTIFSEWVRDYNRRFGGGLSAETLSEATAFYLWATKTAGLDAEEMERIGKGRYGGTWELAGVLGSNFGETEAGNYGVLSKNRSGLETVQLAFGRVRGREGEHFVLPAGEAMAVAAGPAAAEIPAEVAAKAEELGVNATFLNALVNLIDAGYVNLAMYYVGESESGKLDGSLEWISGLYAKPRSLAGGDPYYIPYNESILPPAQAQRVLEAAFALAGVRLR